MNRGTGRYSPLIAIAILSLGMLDPAAVSRPASPAHSPDTLGIRHGSRSLFAVIPTLGVGGPLAVLALLFPSVFGGVFVLFRRWLAFFTVISIISLLFLARWLLNGVWQSWWLTTPGFSFLLIVTTAVGAHWAWRRHWVALARNQHSTVSGRFEHVFLWIMSLACLGTLLFWRLASTDSADWLLLVSFSAGVWAGTAYKAFRSIAGSRSSTPALPTEAMMLGAMLLAMAGLAALHSGPGHVAGTIENVTGAKAGLIGVKWEYQVKESGCILSSPREFGGHVYFASSQPSFKAGTIHCVDAAGGKELWSFNDQSRMRQVLSSPAITAGRLYIGEGFHDDPDCKLYCLDTGTHAKVWEFQTAGQVESSPCVANGRVYFGAGNDGIYCLDAVHGKLIWRFPGPGYRGRLLRMGASPIVINDRLYCGTGVDRNAPGSDFGETAVFCLNAADGTLIWKVATDLPFWGTPVFDGNCVYFGLGNGDIIAEAEAPAGALLCLEASSGKQLWRFDVPDAILEKPAVDEGRVYVGCRDGFCYCVTRDSGKRCWKTSLGSPVIASPVSAASLETGATTSILAIGSRGRVCCLDPATGQIQWTYSLEQFPASLLATPHVVVSRELGGERRRIYLAATLGDLSSGRPVLYRLDDFLITAQPE
jgi:outer membrane protein assembly factor BamB